MRNLIAFLIAIIFISGCQKYPDGPWLSLHSRTERVAGLWDVDYFEVNYEDSTSYLETQPFFGKFAFGKEELSNGLHDFDIQNINGDTKIGHWKFEDNDASLHITMHDGSTSGSEGPVGNDDHVWKIERLKEKEMWLRTDFNGKNYFIKFKLIQNI